MFYYLVLSEHNQNPDIQFTNINLIYKIRLTKHKSDFNLINAEN